MDLLSIVDTLCQIKRIGWLQRGVDNAENVCQHSVLVALLAGELAAEAKRYGMNIDPAEAVALGLIHDIAEAELGHPGNGLRSTIPWDQIELETFERLYPHLADLFAKYRRGEGDLGRLVNFADKLATLIRACSYARRGYPTDDLVRAFVDRLSRYPEPYPQLLKRYLAEYCPSVQL